MQHPTNPPSVIDGLDRPATVFLSYARKDTEAVKDMQLRLKVRGVRCWRDVDDMPVGSHTESEIMRPSSAIGCDCPLSHTQFPEIRLYLACGSPCSVASTQGRSRNIILYLFF